MADSEAAEFDFYGGETKALKPESAVSSSCGVEEKEEEEEETSPDLLKNTAYNIARLEDVIEQCKARHKYLAQTRSSSDGSDVRWYFCKVPLAQNELAASVPNAEIVGKGDYFRFGMRDSLALEASFLQREEELLSYWWKEYAECSEGPKVKPSSMKIDAHSSSSMLEDAQSTEVYNIEEERVGVPVKGGLYEVDLARRHCFPVYWNGENRRVLRGHWFARKGGLDWLPLREDVAEQLEIAYHRQVWRRRRFQPSGLFAARVELQCSTPGLYALFTGEDDTWEAWLNVDASGFSSLITLSGNGIKLRRGYSPSHSPKPTQDELRQRQEEEMDDYCSQVPVRHVVFMVHGIGQRLEKSNLVDDVANFRHITAGLAERHLTSHQRSIQRVLFIPCQWRKGLKLSGESAVERITLDGVRGLRVTLSATVHDVLYYMSPIYCQDIIDSVSNQLNLLFHKFLKRNPGYNGKVSIYGHSLGSVLSYDILCHQENLSSPFPMEWMYREHDKTEENSHDLKKQPYSSEDLGNKILMAADAIKGEKDEDCCESGPLTQREEHVKDAFTTAEPVTSDLHEVGSSMGSGSSTEGTHAESLCDSEDGESDQGNVNCGKSSPMNSGKVHEDLCDTPGNKDEIIKLLQEEIESLKAKIANQDARQGNDISAESNREKEKTNNPMPDQTILQRPSSGQDSESKSYTPYIKYTKLAFKVDTFFAVGSPLGVFLSLRNIRIGIGRGKDYWEEENISEEMPACRQMFNIFHPYDPVAYRVEPLVCKEYIHKRPVIIPYHRGGKRLHIGLQEFTEDLAAHSQAIVYRLNSVRVKVLTACQSRESDKADEVEESPQGPEERSYGSLMMERLTGSEEGRIDHMLQDKTFEHPFLQAIGAHTNYWRDNDTALFILKHLYSDISEDPPSPKECEEGNSKTEDSATKWSDKRETVDEEHLPLTFSNRTMTKNFSRKVKEFMK